MEYGLRDLLLDEEFPEAFSHVRKNFWSVKTAAEAWQWARGPLVGALEADLLLANELVGGVRFRQLRVAADSCGVDPSYPAAFVGACFGPCGRLRSSVHAPAPRLTPAPLQGASFFWAVAARAGCLYGGGGKTLNAQG